MEDVELDTEVIEPRERFTENLNTRVRPSEREAIENAADELGVSRSELIRQAALQVAEQVLPPTVRTR